MLYEVSLYISASCHRFLTYRSFGCIKCEVRAVQNKRRQKKKKNNTYTKQICMQIFGKKLGNEHIWNCIAYRTGFFFYFRFGKICKFHFMNFYFATRESSICACFLFVVINIREALNTAGNARVEAEVANNIINKKMISQWLITQETLHGVREGPKNYAYLYLSRDWTLQECEQKMRESIAWWKKNVFSNSKTKTRFFQEFSLCT